MHRPLFLRLAAIAVLAAGASTSAHAAGLIAAEPPPAIVTDLSRVDALADQIAICAATEKTPSDWAELAQTSRAQADAVKARAQALFGAIQLSAPPDAAPPPKCRRWSRSDARQTITELTQSVDAGLNAIASPTRRGLWLGLFPLCAETVHDVTGQELVNHGWSITVRLRADAAATLGSYSARFVRAALSLPISFRVNGAELSQPRVTEPISDAMVLTWTGDQISYDLVMQSIAASCPPGLGGRA